MGKYGPYTQNQAGAGGTGMRDEYDVRYRQDEKTVVDEFDRLVSHIENDIEQYEKTKDVHTIFEAQHDFGYAKAYHFYFISKREFGEAFTKQVIKRVQELYIAGNAINIALREISKGYSEASGYY